MSDLAVCAQCGALQAWTRAACQCCGARDFTTVPLPVPGTIYSVTTVRRSPDPARAAPYSVTLVRGEHGGLLMLPWDGPAPAIDAPVMILQGEAGLIARPRP